jgi:hypothetical protein
MIFWKARSTWSHAANLNDPVASNSFSASQAEAIDIEILLSSQGSRIVNMEKSSIVHSFLVRAHNLQILRIEQGSMPRIDRSNLLHFSLLLSQTQSVVHWAFLVLLPITIDYLDRWAPSSSVSRPYDAMTSLYHQFPQPYLRHRDRVSWPCRAPCCIHQITDWVNWPLQPHSGYKMEPFNRNRRYESSTSIKLGIVTVLVLLLVSLATCHSSNSPSYFNLPEQTVLRLHFRRQEEARSRPKAEINPSCHLWLRLQKSSSRFAGNC